MKDDMQKSWFSIFPRNPWLSIYAWVIFCILPFFFIFRSSEPIAIIIGIFMVLLFFLSYRFSFKSKSGLVYMWISFEMLINMIMTILFGYVYLTLFIAFFIGNIRNPVGFFLMYSFHLATTVGVVIAGFLINFEFFMSFLPFLLITVIGAVLLPFNLYNRHKREKLEGQLEVANERISELVIFEERQRIARDLHDTLGQKLSLIGLKSDLAGKLVSRDPAAAVKELHDIRQTASTALNEVRELVTNMRSVRVKDELVRIVQMVKAAEMELTIHGSPDFTNTPTIVENVLSMCLKEAITNVVKHSQGTECGIVFEQHSEEVVIQVKDNGVGILESNRETRGSGLKGMRERLEFVNGSLSIVDDKGTTLEIRVPIVITQYEQEELS